MTDLKVDTLISEASLLTFPQDYLDECTNDITSVFGNASMDVSVPIFQWEENQNTPFSLNQAQQNVSIYDCYDEEEAPTCRSLNFES